MKNAISGDTKSIFATSTNSIESIYLETFIDNKMQKELMFFQPDITEKRDCRIDYSVQKKRDEFAYLEVNSKSLICIDEVQRYPEIFQIFRNYLDKNNHLLLPKLHRDSMKHTSN